MKALVMDLISYNLLKCYPNERRLLLIIYYKKFSYSTVGKIGKHKNVIGTTLVFFGFRNAHCTHYSLYPSCDHSRYKQFLLPLDRLGRCAHGPIN